MALAFSGSGFRATLVSSGLPGNAIVQQSGADAEMTSALEIDAVRAIGDAPEVARDGADALVCEGVGGLLVPLAPGYCVRDFAVDLGLPLVVVASPGLGTINHTLLTIEAARAAELVVELIVLNPWPDSPNQIEESNRETIAALAGIPVETLPRIDLDDPPSWPRLALS